MPAVCQQGNMAFSLVIFDCDGVLVDSEILSAEVEAQELTRLGAKVSTEQAMRLFLGMTQEDMEREIETHFGLKVPDDHAATTSTLLRQAYVERLQPIAGVRELLQKLPMPFCVASNSPPAKLGLGLSITNLFELVYPHVYCAKLVARGKPAPDLFLHAAGMFGVAPERAVVVEDSVAGITAAKAAGMTAIGFIGGLHHVPPSGETLRMAGADHIATTMQGVARLIGV